MKDPYINPNGVLINKMGITDYQELNKAEADIGFVKLIDVDSVPTGDFDEELIKRIHRHIFEDIFSWAGEYRTIPIEKQELVLPGCSIPYSYPNEIAKDLRKRIRELNETPWDELSGTELAETFARKIALLWRVHPFRDGNTRTTLSFSYLYAKKHGFPLNMRTFIENLNREYDGDRVVKYNIRDKFALACLDEKDYPEVEHLARVFAQACNKEKEDKPKSH